MRKITRSTIPPEYWGFTAEMNYRDASIRGIGFAQSATSVSTLDLDRLTPVLSLCDASIGEFTLLRLKKARRQIVASMNACRKAVDILKDGGF